MEVCGEEGTYQRVFVIHEPSVVQSEPAFLEAFGVLQTDTDRMSQKRSEL